MSCLVFPSVRTAFCRSFRLVDFYAGPQQWLTTAALITPKLASTMMPMRFQARSLHARPALRMSYDPDAKIKELGIELPSVAAAAANYVCVQPLVSSGLPAWRADTRPPSLRARPDPVCLATQVPYIVSGNYVYVAGQIPVLNGEIQFKGTVSKDQSMDIAYQSARLCGLNIIAQVRSHLLDLRTARETPECVMRRF